MTTQAELLQIQELLKQADAKGLPVPIELFEQVKREYLVKAVERLCKGKSTDEEVRTVVGFYWPHLLHTQEVPIDTWQCRIVRHIMAGRKTNMNQVFIKGCTKAGKGFSVAVASCLWFESAKECKVVITSNTSTHAQNVMFGEILRLRRSMIGCCKASMGNQIIKDGTQRYITIASPDNTESFSGIHGPATFFIFDEASGVREELWDMAQTQAAMCVALSNPRNATGWFRAAFPQGNPDETQVIDITGGRRSLVTIGGLDCINVREGKLLIPTQIDRERYETIKAKSPRWGRVFGDGRFPEEDESLMLILPSWLDRHHRAWSAEIPIEAFGLDMAASDTGDRSVLAAGSGAGCYAVLEKQDIDTMVVVAWVLRTIQEKWGINLRDGINPIAVDMDGLGKGAGDRLKEVGCWVIEFRGNARSQLDPKTYSNLRAEAYGELSNRLNPKGAWPDEPWALPRDGEIDEDLVAPERIYGSDGIQFRITPKQQNRNNTNLESLQKKLGRSPDKGDAIVYMYHAVREFLKGAMWRELQTAPLVASGDDPEEKKPLTQDEVEELPDWLKDIVEESRETAKSAINWQPLRRFG